MEEIKALLGNLKDNDWWVRKETAGKLLAYPEELHLSDLEKRLRNEDAVLRNASMKTYTELGERGEDNDVRAEVALAIGRLRTPEAAEVLQALSRDPVEEVQAAALISLRNSERDVYHQC